LGLVTAAALVVTPTYSAEPEPMGAKPGPEHDILKKMEGTWDTHVKGFMDPSKPPMESKGTAVWKMECGGLWLVGDFKGEFAGKPFQGRSLDTYDAHKKKYVSIWVDSMATQPMISEGSYDKEKKALVMTSDYTPPGEKPAKFKSVTEMKDDDTLVFTMSTLGKDDKETVMMTITYKRKK
jgi:hypothetical protein